MRVLGAVMHDDRGVLSHQHVSRVVLIRIHRVSDFVFFFLGFYLRDFAAQSDGASLTDVSVVFHTVILDSIVIYLHILLFYLSCVIYLSFSYSISYARLVMRT
jgi:hypothetical protein